jgi:uncharacterized protein YjbI with pentapeptide repeats
VELDERQQRIAEQRTQDLALQSYLDSMSALVLEDLDDPEVRAVMRARTLTVLDRLDPSRKTEVMAFLDEADLVHTSDEHPKPVISLNGADLHYANLENIELTGSKLNEADLHRAYLPSASLRDPSMVFADLRGARLGCLNPDQVRWVPRECTILKGAKMYPDDVNDMVRNAYLEGAIMPDGRKYEEWIKDKKSNDQ